MTRKVAKTLSLFDLMTRFPTEADAIRYIERRRWGDTPTCTRCGASDKTTAQKKHAGRYWCGHCRKYFTARTGTPLESAKVDARKWIYAAYLLLTSRKGISSLQLSKELSVTQTTAWYMLHRLRLACGDDLQALTGTVEIDETYIGGKERNKHRNKQLGAGRGTVGKTAVLGMRERGGRTRALPIGTADKATIGHQINRHIRPGATIYTDDHGAYRDIGGVLYSHDSVNHSAQEYIKGAAHTNGIESVWAVLKRGYNGVYHHWSKKHMRRYIDEFAFRLNDGACEIDTEKRMDALFQGMGGKTVTYAGLTS